MLNFVVITVLVITLLTSMPAAYVFAIEEENKKTETTKSDNGDSSNTGSNTDNPSDVGKPDVSPTPGETNDKNTVNQPTEPTKELPKCDGSFQDCTTRNGDTCNAGEGGEKCECAPDNSDCQKNPNVISNPIVPAIKQVVGSGPDGDCLFHPELPKCKSDNGVCPDGFAQNEDGNCFPRHDKCPKGFHGHEDDETGRCIPDSVPCEKGFVRDPDFPTCSSIAHVCRDHPGLKICGGKGEDDGNHNHKTIVIEKHTTSSSHSLSNSCFNEIKIAWIGKISRGENSKVDKIIDNCLNIK